MLAAFTLVYSALAARIERTWVSGPIVFLSFGLLFGPSALNLLPDSRDPELLRTLAELTLAVVLFTDATGAHLGVLRRARQLPIRLLTIGLPLTILAGAGLGWLLFDGLSGLEIALLAVMLAPTDAALGKAVVTNPDVPDPIRQALNVESGLNDGICVPVLFLFLTLAAEVPDGATAWEIGFGLLARNVGIGLLAGAIPSILAVGLLRICKRRDWLSESWSKVTVIGLAFLCFGTAQAFGGSGFIACFAGGLLFGGLFEPHHDELLDSAEGIGDTFSLLTWVLFGSAVVGPSLVHFSVPVVLYSLLSLTLVRMVPVYLVSLGLGLSMEGKLFLGWFGPRGLASIVFAVIAIGANLPHDDTINHVVACTVILSILLHGVTANVWARGFAARSTETA
jgi:NhaP-type Na+/H+ or K+/H+ antiporter